MGRISRGCHCLFMTNCRHTIDVLSLQFSLRGLNQVCLCRKLSNSVFWRHKISFLFIRKFLLWLFVAVKNIELWQIIISCHDKLKWWMKVVGNLEWLKEWKHQTISSLLVAILWGQCFDWLPHPRCENSIGCLGLVEEDYSLHHSHDTYIVTDPSVLMELNSGSHVPSYSIIDRPYQTHRSDGWSTGSPHCPWAVSIWANNILLLSDFHDSRNFSWSWKFNCVILNCIVSDALHCIKYMQPWSPHYLLDINTRNNLLWGSCTNPWEMEFGLRPAQQHASPKHSNNDKKQGGNLFQ